MRVIVLLNEFLCLGHERYLDKNRVVVFGLARSVFEAAIHDVVIGELVEITHTATNVTLKHKNVTLQGNHSFKRSCLQLETFLLGNIEGGAIFSVVNRELVEGVAISITFLHAPEPIGLKNQQNVIQRILAARLWATALNLPSEFLAFFIHLIKCLKIAAIAAFHLFGFLITNPIFMFFDKESPEAFQVFV